jgi:hypothetical protein
MANQQEVVLLGERQVGNLLTMQKRIEQEIHKPGHTDQVRISIITAMNWYKHMEFYFNQGTHEFELTTNVQSYPKEESIVAGVVSTAGWPADIERIIDTYVKVGGSRWLKMRQCSIDEIRYLTPTSTTVGVPEKYAYFEEKIWLTPIPNDSSSTPIRIDYVKDLGIPTYAWVGSEWKFYSPGSAALLHDSFTNRWLDDAEELIRTRAKYDLYQHYYDDAENAQKMAQHESVSLGNLRSRNDAYNAEQNRTPIYI